MNNKKKKKIALLSSFFYDNNRKNFSGAQFVWEEEGTLFVTAPEYISLVVLSLITMIRKKRMLRELSIKLQNHKIRMRNVSYRNFRRRGILESLLLNICLTVNSFPNKTITKFRTLVVFGKMCCTINK